MRSVIRALALGSLIACCFAIAAPSAAGAAPTYSIKAIIPPGGLSSNAADINPEGNVAGSETTSKGNLGFLYYAKTGAYRVLQPPSGDSSDNVNGLNKGNHMAATGSSDVSVAQPFEAHVLKNKAAWVPVPTPGSTTPPFSTAQDINPHDSLAVNILQPQFLNRAAIATHRLHKKYVTHLENLGSGFNISHANAIDEDGRVAGWQGTQTDPTATVWTPQGKPILLDGSSANDIAEGKQAGGSESGGTEWVTVVGAQGSEVETPCAWHGRYVAGKLTFDPCSPLPATFGRALGISPDGKLIVGQTPANGATLWIGSNAYDLNSLIPSGSGWRLISAVAVNSHGDIVGNGLLNGVSTGFLLTPG